MSDPRRRSMSDPGGLGPDLVGPGQPRARGRRAREQALILTKRFESLESVAKELASTRDVNSMLETITRRAGVAVRAPRYLSGGPTARRRRAPDPSRGLRRRRGRPGGPDEVRRSDSKTERPVAAGGRHRVDPGPLRTSGRLLPRALPLLAPGALAADGLRRACRRGPRDRRRPRRVT